VLSDAAIIAAAKARPADLGELRALPAFARLRRRPTAWWSAIEEATDLTEAELPPRHAEDGPPPARSWERRNPEAAARLLAVREAIAQRAEELGIPTEVLIAPDLVRSLVWDFQGPMDIGELRARLTPARPWQLDQVATLIAKTLAAG
jgi:ribonuclease D